MAELTAHGCERIFQEKISGKKRDRAELERLLRFLRGGDVVIVTRLDRLARSTRDLLNLVKEITEINATFKSIKDGWAVDTSTAMGRLMLYGTGWHWGV